MKIFNLIEEQVKFITDSTKETFRKEKKCGNCWGYGQVVCIMSGYENKDICDECDGTGIKQKDNE